MTVIFICLTPFFKVYLGLISWLIGLKELVSLTMIAMETGVGSIRCGSIPVGGNSPSIGGWIV